MRSGRHGRCDIPARIIGYARRGKPLIVEHGNSPEAHVAFYRKLQNFYGYRVAIECIDAPPEPVTPRPAARGIPVSEQTVDKRRSALRRVLPACEALGDALHAWPVWRENG